MVGNKVAKLLARLAEVEEELGRPTIHSDQARFRALAQEHAYLREIKTVSDTLQNLQQQLQDNKELLKIENDPAFADVLKEDIGRVEPLLAEWDKKLTDILVPPDPDDHRNTILELRAGTGGDEAALFVGDCARMYRMFADRMGWKIEILSCTESELGGFKEYIFVLSGKNAYRYLRYEGGTHRVQRVPETEAQGRVHTSAITVAAIPEPDENVDIVIEEKDLRIDTYRSSGAGGQNVQKTDSAVRLTHIPSGLVVTCQDERSQHKNRDRALRVLKARLADLEAAKKQQAMTDSRAGQVGTGDRSERIRTYNFPQNRITDHRIEFTRYNLDRVMEGDLQELTTTLVAHYKKEKLEE